MKFNIFSLNSILIFFFFNISIKIEKNSFIFIKHHSSKAFLGKFLISFDRIEVYSFFPIEK